MPWTTDRIVGTAIAALIELFLLWRIWRSLRLAHAPLPRETPPPFTVPGRPLLPAYYRPLLFCLVLAAIAVGGIIALIAGGLVSLDPHSEAGVVRVGPACDSASSASTCP